MAFGHKRKSEDELIKEYEKTEKALKSIYSNKSSDEYKMHGDITLSPSYDKIDEMIAELSDLKGFSKSDAREFATCFSTLHRPIFKKMVSEYMHSPNEVNTTYTVTFTTGYRVLVGELSRVLACTEATENGIVYKPDKVARKHNSAYIMKHYNSSLETGLNSYTKSHSKNARVIKQESAVGDLLVIGMDGAKFVIDTITKLFSYGAKEFNPISFINAVLMKSYDKKIQKFEDAKKDYELAKEAYADYLKLPKNERNRRTEHRYMKLITKYNIKMQNLKAKVDHFDQRSEEEAKQKRAKLKEDRIIYGDDDDDDDIKKDDGDDNKKSSSDSSSAYDFDF